VVDALPDDTAGGGAFAQLRGQLRLPVRGTLVGRFGAPRGTGGATWKGVFVATDSGADVHAVAAGRVVFADDLRGFGNLVIVDHGDQYLSIYGNNAALLRRTGDAVKAGDVIARAGNSSGDEQTGLYFELRFRGRPFDPMNWTVGH
jgi:septal ring factor EnvC (AmiA/AmiB activator)